MPRVITESDWRIFRDLHAIALERFCQRVLSALRQNGGSPVGSMQPPVTYDSPAPVPTKNSTDVSEAKVGFVAGYRPHFFDETAALLRRRLTTAVDKKRPL
jgi:hypothetical protein